MGQHLELFSYEFDPNPCWGCRSDQIMPMWEYLNFIGKHSGSGVLCCDDIVRVMELAMDTSKACIGGIRVYLPPLEWWDIEKLVGVIRAIEDEDGDRNVYHYHKD